MDSTATSILVAFGADLAIGVVAVGAYLGLRRRGVEINRHRFTVTLTVFLVAFGVVLPTLAILDGTRADERARGGVKLTEAQVEGRQQFAARCAQCHALAASNAVGKVGPDLDTIRPAAPLVADAIEKGRARGHGYMPPGLVTGSEAQGVADYVAAVAGR